MQLDDHNFSISVWIEIDFLPPEVPLSLKTSFMD